MILYDKKCNLLGVSRDVIGFLGYEDIEEFKTYTNDIADLFVNRSGYVYKFQNFSWIDYILHSGAPNKNAIIKLKNGKEVESRISIEEIILLNKLGENESLYKVDIFNNYLGSSDDQIIQKNISSITQHDFHEDILHTKDEEKDNLSFQEDITIDNNENISKKQSESAPTLIEDFDFSSQKLKLDDETLTENDENEEDIEEITKNDIPKFDLNDDFKLSIKTKDEIKEDTLDEKEKTSLSFNLEDELDELTSLKNEDTSFDFEEPFQANEEEHEEIKIKNYAAQDLLEESTIEEESILESDSQCSTPIIEDLEPMPPQEREFFIEESNDCENYISKTADILGVDEDTLKSILSEYAEQLTLSIEEIQDAFLQSNQEKLIEIIEELKSISTNLRLDELTLSLELFLRPWEEIPTNCFEEYESKIENLKNKIA